MRNGNLKKKSNENFRTEKYNSVNERKSLDRLNLRLETWSITLISDFKKWYIIKRREEKNEQKVSERTNEAEKVFKEMMTSFGKPGIDSNTNKGMFSRHEEKKLAKTSLNL